MNQDDQIINQIQTFVSALPSNYKTEFILLDKIVDIDTDLEKYLARVLEKYFLELGEDDYRSIIFRISHAVENKFSILDAHPAIVHIIKKNNNLEIFLDDSLEGLSFINYRLFLTAIKKENNNYIFHPRDFSNLYKNDKFGKSIRHTEFSIFHGNSYSHFSVLHLLELWGKNPIEMRNSILNKKTTEAIMSFSDSFRKIKSYATDNPKEDLIVDLAKKYKSEYKAHLYKKIIYGIKLKENELFQKYSTDKNIVYFVEKILESSKLNNIKKILNKSDYEKKLYIESLNNAFEKHKKNIPESELISAEKNKEIEREAREFYLYNHHIIDKILNAAPPDNLVENYTQGLLNFKSSFYEKFRAMQQRCGIPEDSQHFSIEENNVFFEQENDKLWNYDENILDNDHEIILCDYKRQNSSGSESEDNEEFENEEEYAVVAAKFVELFKESMKNKIIESSSANFFNEGKVKIFRGVLELLNRLAPDEYEDLADAFTNKRIKETLALPQNQDTLKYVIRGKNEYEIGEFVLFYLEENPRFEEMIESFSKPDNTLS